MAKLVIEVSGGCDRECYTDAEIDEVILVDWDNLEAGAKLDQREAQIARELGCRIDDEYVSKREPLK